MPSHREPFLPAPFTHTEPAPRLIAQGAEALLFRTCFLSPSTPAALKARPSKPYRHPVLDARLTKQRVLAEARILVKLSSLANDPDCEIHVPAVLSLDWDLSRRGKRLRNGEQGKPSSSDAAGAWLLMEWIDGQSLKELLYEWDRWLKHDGSGPEARSRSMHEQDVKQLLRRIGRAIGQLHSKGGVIHGDLTSSNIMIRSPMADSADSPQTASTPAAQPSTHPLPAMTGDIVLIDFGLATTSIQDEDRAVDLYVLERAFGSTHPSQEDWFDPEVLQSQDGYRGSFKGANTVLKRLEDVRLRGRKRSMVG